GILKLDYEFILIFKKQGEAPRPTKEQKEQSAMTKEEWNTYFSGHWNFAGAKQDGHIAMFPEELPRRLIKMFAFQDDTVLDPFMGSGTTNLAARNLGRNSVGYEINPEFVEIAKQKLGVNQPDLVGTEYDFQQDKASGDFELAIELLPYRFKDPHKLDKKVDPRKLSFGSRIDKENGAQREELFTVKEALSPEKVLLSNGLTIRLLGIKSDPVLKDKAVGYLNEKIKGKRIFLKYDWQKYDEENNLLCYLYLQNKTFVNAHLIRSGFVDIETDSDYKHKGKFLTLLEKVNG
ncbi:MAG: site-specific DNA-methyltransferase, partial [Chlorobium sp.]|nr:site-specific DNA-methyltransferase [Chlorobium sp.]